MEVHQLEYFLAVHDHGSINAASTYLDLAQPTISQAIRALEREHGVELFHRIGRGMVLTSAGHALVGPARKILRAIAVAEGSVAADAGELRGRLEIVAMPSLLTGAVAAMLGRFRRRYPRVLITIVDLRDESEAAGMIRDGQCDLVLGHLPLAEGTDRYGEAPLEVVELGALEYWVAYPPGTKLGEENPIPWSALPTTPLVVVPRGSSSAAELEQAVARAGRLAKAAAIVAHREARLPFVLAGVGGTFLERSLAEAAAARGAVVRAVEPPLSRPYGMVYDSETLSPAAEGFVALAAGAAGAAPALGRPTG